MTYPYPFRVGFTKLGVATAPSDTPTINVIDCATGNLLVTGANVTKLANMPGACIYDYVGATGLNLIGLVHSTDTTLDQQDLYSYPGIVSTIEQNVALILADYARRTGDYNTVAPDNATIAALAVAITNIMGVGWTDETLVALMTALSAIPTNPLLTNDARLPATAIAAATDIPSAADIDTQLSGTHGAGLWDASSGPGATPWPIVVNDPSGNPIDGVNVWISTDIAGANVIFNGFTNALGTVTPMLDPGDYYAWKQLAGYTFTNPEAFTV